MKGHELAGKTRFRANRHQFVRRVAMHNHVPQHAQHAFDFTHFKPCLSSSSAHHASVRVCTCDTTRRSELASPPVTRPMRTVSASRNDFIATVMPPCADREIGPVVIACLEVFVRGRSVWTQRRNERDFWLGLERRRRGVCPGGYASD